MVLHLKRCFLILGVVVFLASFALGGCVYTGRNSQVKSVAHYMMAVCADIHGQTAEAMREYRRCVFLDPNNSAPRLRLGAYYLRLDDTLEAIEQFEAIVCFDRKNVSVLYVLGTLYAQKNDFFKAIVFFEQVLRLEPHNAQALNALGYLYAKQGVCLNQAFLFTHQAIALDPCNGAYYDSLGWVLYKQGLYAQSLKVLQKATLYVEDKVLYDHMGDVFNALKEYDQADIYWQKSLSLDANQIMVQQKIKELEKWNALPLFHPQN